MSCVSKVIYCVTDMACDLQWHDEFMSSVMMDKVESWLAYTSIPGMCVYFIFVIYALLLL